MKRNYLILTITLMILVVVVIFIAIKMHRSTSTITPVTITPSVIKTVSTKEQSSDSSTKKTDGLEPKFIDVVPVTYHADTIHKIPIQERGVVSLKVSPDGRRILYTAKRSGTHIIGMIDLVSNKQTMFDLSLDDYVDASWSTDGKMIVLAGKKKSDWEIYLYELESRTLKQITCDPNRKKSWPRFSPYKFDGYYRIAYVSEKNNRKDIWWVRESGEFDMPITQANSKYDSSSYWGDMPPPPAITLGGNAPAWSPSGNLLLYKTSSGYSVLDYNFSTWWTQTHLETPKTNAIATWSPNQTAFLLYDSVKQSAVLTIRNDLKHIMQISSTPISAIDYFPDGKAFAYATFDGNQPIIEVKPYDDPLGDVTNLWMYPYSQSQKDKIGKNQLLFLDTGFEQIYNIYETERYYCGGVDPNFPARPYIITSDAVLETFYAAYAALYSAMERFQLKALLTEFSHQALMAAQTQKTSMDALVFFETGLGLLDPQTRSTLSPQASIEIARVESATESAKSLWGQNVDYSDFYIRGKYESDTAMQGYFRAVKWYQEFTLNLDSIGQREQAIEINSIANAPAVLPSLQHIHNIYRNLVGETRYLTPLCLKTIPAQGSLVTTKPDLPWIQTVNNYRLFPTVYTLDAYIFDELVTHLYRPITVGTADNPRILPKGLDIMAGLGSQEGFDILTKEFNESRFQNYQTTLINVKKKIEGMEHNAWEANLYQQWLYALQALVAQPNNSNLPTFTKTSAWKRKQLNTALGSWVNLRYETIAVVEQIAAECGEGGYEQLNIGKPRGYVEPNPEFFKRLDEGFARIGDLMQQAFSDSTLSAAAQNRVSEYRTQIQNLGTMAQKELAGKELTDSEYEQILNIGGTIEQFILIMGCLNGNQDEHAVHLPDPISKIVDVQKDGINGVRLYEALGDANEVDVIVPFFGRRQITKGSVYSYYEFTSGKDFNSQLWRSEKEKTLPSWISTLHDGTSNPPLYELPDLRTAQ